MWRWSVGVGPGPLCHWRTDATTVCLRRRATRGAITVLAAFILFIIVLLGVAAWAGTQEWADHTLLLRLAGNAAYDASHRTADQGLVAGTPLLACLAPACTPATCATALSRNPAATTAAGAACRSLRQGLNGAYGGAHARVDVAATLASTRVWTLAPGAHDPENASLIYHYPTVCLSIEASVGVIAYDGLSIHQHIYACAQAVFR